MKTKRVVEGCPELEYYSYQIYALPENWWERWAMSHRVDYHKVRGDEDELESKLVEHADYEVYAKELGTVLSEEILKNFPHIFSDEHDIMLDYLGSPVKPASRLLRVDGDEYSKKTFALYLSTLGFKNHEVEYAADRKDRFSVRENV